MIFVLPAYKLLNFSPGQEGTNFLIGCLVKDIIKFSKKYVNVLTLQFLILDSEDFKPHF